MKKPKTTRAGRTAPPPCWVPRRKCDVCERDDKPLALTFGQALCPECSSVAIRAAYPELAPNNTPHLRGEAPAEPRKSGGACCAED